MILDDNYRIETNRHEVRLVREELTDRINEKTDEAITSRDTWYFPNFEQALKKYCNESLKPCKNVLEVLEAIKEQNKLINILNK